MTAFLHHTAVVVRLLVTTRAGLVALLVFTNTLPMAAMQAFSPGSTAFSGRLGLITVDRHPRCPVKDCCDAADDGEVDAAGQQGTKQAFVVLRMANHSSRGREK